MPARSIWSGGAWRCCGRGRCGRRRGRAIGRGRSCKSTGPRCRRGRGSAAASGASTRWFFDWLDGVVRECVYDNLRSAVARREGDQITWNQRFLALRGHYAFHATACTPATPREKGSVEGGVRHLKTGFWPAQRFGSLGELDEHYARWRDRVCNRRIHATGRFSVVDRFAHEREVLRPLPPTAFDFAGARLVRVPLDGYLKLTGNFYRGAARAGSSARRAAL